MGIPRKGGQCLAVIYSNIVALNTRLFSRSVRRQPSKKINTKKLPEMLFGMPPRAINHQLSCPFELASGSFLIGRRRILVIPRDHLVTDYVKMYQQQYEQENVWKLGHNINQFPPAYRVSLLHSTGDNEPRRHP